MSELTTLIIAASSDFMSELCYKFELCERPHSENSPEIIGLFHPLDGITNPKYKLLCFLTTNFCKEKKALAFNWDRCCHLALCLWLILFHFHFNMLYNFVFIIKQNY